MTITFHHRTVRGLHRVAGPRILPRRVEAPENPRHFSPLRLPFSFVVSELTRRGVPQSTAEKISTSRLPKLARLLEKDPQRSIRWPTLTSGSVGVLVEEFLDFDVRPEILKGMNLANLPLWAELIERDIFSRIFPCGQNRIRLPFESLAKGLGLYASGLRDQIELLAANPVAFRFVRALHEDFYPMLRVLQEELWLHHEYVGWKQKPELYPLLGYSAQQNTMRYPNLLTAYRILAHFIHEAETNLINWLETAKWTTENEQIMIQQLQDIKNALYRYPPLKRSFRAWVSDGLDHFQNSMEMALG